MDRFKLGVLLEELGTAVSRNIVDKRMAFLHVAYGTNLAIYLFEERSNFVTPTDTASTARWYPFFIRCYTCLIPNHISPVPKTHDFETLEIAYLNC